MMRIHSFILACIVALSAAAATPGAFRLQVIATDGSSVVADKEMTVRVSLRQGKATSKNIYVESHDAKSDAMGLVTVNVGEGKATTGDFSTIAWAGNDTFVEVEVDKGEGFISMGTSQVAAVPYALVADRAEKLVLTSTGGKRFAVAIDDDGNLTATPLAD